VRGRAGHQGTVRGGQGDGLSDRGEVPHRGRCSGVPALWGRLRLIATLHDPVVIRKILAHLSRAPSEQSPGPRRPRSDSILERCGGRRRVGTVQRHRRRTSLAARSPYRLTAKVRPRSIRLSLGGAAGARGGQSYAMCLRLHRTCSAAEVGWRAGAGAQAVGERGAYALEGGLDDLIGNVVRVDSRGMREAGRHPGLVLARLSRSSGRRP
jgi:hypothetical protein